MKHRISYQPTVFKLEHSFASESKKQLEASPFIESCKKRGYEVLFMTDPIDEYSMQQLKDYEDKKFVCLTKDGVSRVVLRLKHNFPQGLKFDISIQGYEIHSMHIFS